MMQVFPALRKNHHWTFDKLGKLYMAINLNIRLQKLEDRLNPIRKDMESQFDFSKLSNEELVELSNALKQIHPTEGSGDRIITDNNIIRILSSVKI
jgi:hypothetical protein